MDKYVFFALRPQHWVKNLLMFIPLIFGKKVFVFPENFRVLEGFIVFCLASSAVYVANDLIDLKKDRAHPLKRLRPIACGKVGIFQARVLVSFLAACAAMLSFGINPEFGILILGYFIFNLAYSYFLKDIVIVDVFCLSGFFLLRIIAGTVIAKVSFSHWMIFMTALLALFLGLNKRRQELRMLKEHVYGRRSVLAKYSLYFIDQMVAVVTSSIVIVYMLYVVDRRTVHYFGTNHLYYSMPFVYYGIFRYLYLIHKKCSLGDPTNIFFQDRMMQLNIILWVNICIWVIYFGF
jgi:4-hydroxybenzoate polyprenyltransferase